MVTTHTVGDGKYTYTVDKHWGRGAASVSEFGLVSAVAGDSQDRVYLYIRQPVAEILVLDPQGTLLGRWGAGQFVEPHMLFISPRDELYATDITLHTVTKWTLDGQLLQTWGTPNVTGAPGAPFNKPTRAVVTPDGELYVSDGYGQRRVHRFGADGQLIHSWGAEGTAPGEFALPHDVWVDPRDRVLVCDRENARVELFDRAGNYLGEWPGLANPMQIFVRDDVLYLAESNQRVSVLTLDGDVLARWGSKGPAPDQFTDAPHSIWADSRGDIYVSEVVAHNKLQKYVRT
jgi:DNA-binding beta-propeller fold protein YncE